MPLCMKITIFFESHLFLESGNPISGYQKIAPIPRWKHPENVPSPKKTLFQYSWGRGDKIMTSLVNVTKGWLSTLYAVGKHPFHPSMINRGKGMLRLWLNLKNLHLWWMSWWGLVEIWIKAGRRRAKNRLFCVDTLYGHWTAPLIHLIFNSFRIISFVTLFFS